MYNGIVKNKSGSKQRLKPLNIIQRGEVKVKMLTFKGGIHPCYYKASTKHAPITKLIAPKELIFPMQQHLGAPCTPLVTVGEHVKKGQKIADVEAFISAPIHASVSGKVIAIEPRMHPNGTKVMSIIIENDGLDTPDHRITAHPDWENLSPKQIANIVREAGVVGMGGACFPTHVKLSPPPDKKIEWVIINGAECEPFLTSDHRVMLETPERVTLGLKIMLKTFGVKKGYIGIESNKMDAIKVMKAAAAKEASIEVVVLQTKYPQGSEKQLIKAITGREVPSGGLPADVGVAVNNIDTCVAIGRAVMTGKPLTKRVVTVSGDAVGKPANYSVRIGTPMKALIEESGGFIKEPKKIIFGGPMMGISQSSLEAPIIKGTSGLLAFTKERAFIPPESPCIRCGRCVQSCPMNLMPLYLNAFAVRDEIEKTEAYHAADCLECGSCSYACPSKRHLVETIRVAKHQIIAQRRAAAAKK